MIKIRRIAKFVVFILLPFQGWASESDVVSHRQSLSTRQLYKLGMLWDWSERDAILNTVQAIKAFKNEEPDTRSKLEACIRRGSHHAMYHLAQLCKAQDDLEEALEWSLLSFQIQWLKHGTHYQEALDFLKELNDRPKASWKGKRSNNMGVLLDNFLKNRLAGYVKNTNNVVRSACFLFDKNTLFQTLCLSSVETQDNLYKVIFCAECKQDTVSSHLAEQLAKEELGVKFSKSDRFMFIKRLVFSLPQSLKWITSTQIANIGLAYYESHDYEYAQELLEFADIPEAWASLGSLYMDGHIAQSLNATDRNAKAVELFQKAQTDHALRNLGILYVGGQIDNHLAQEERDQTALQLFKKSGLPEAYDSIGFLYMKGRIGSQLSDTERDQKAKEYFEKSGTPQALTYIGCLYMERRIETHKSKVELDELAAHFFRKTNTPDANFNLGQLYREGLIEHSLSPKDRNKKAADCYRAAGKMHEAMNNLGALYLDEGIAWDIPAKKRHQMAHKLFEESNTPTSKCFLGNMYYHCLLGKNMSRQHSYQKAEEFFRLSGLPESQYNLGTMFIEGKLGSDLSVQKRYQKAYEHYLAAAEAGITPGFNALGCVIKHPKFKPEWSESERCKQAKIWFEKSGTANAKMNLALMYMEKESAFEGSKMERYGIAQAYALEAHSLGLADGQELADLLDQKMEALSNQDSSKVPDAERDQDFKIQIDELKEQKAEDLSPKNQSTSLVDSVENFDLSSDTINNISLAKPISDIETSRTKQRHQEKKHNKSIRDRLRVIAQRTFLDDIANPQSRIQLTLKFKDKSVEQEFYALGSSNKKASEIFEDLICQPWGTDGVGKPELLKGKLKGYYSRRLNHKDRILYLVEDHETIYILSCKGHYDL